MPYSLSHPVFQCPYTFIARLDSRKHAVPPGPSAALRRCLVRLADATGVATPATLLASALYGQRCGASCGLRDHVAHGPCRRARTARIDTGCVRPVRTGSARTPSGSASSRTREPVRSHHHPGWSRSSHPCQPKVAAAIWSSSRGGIVPRLRRRHGEVSRLLDHPARQRCGYRRGGVGRNPVVMRRDSVPYEPARSYRLLRRGYERSRSCLQCRQGRYGVEAL